MGPEKNVKSAWGPNLGDKLHSNEESPTSADLATTLDAEEANGQPASPVKAAFQRPTTAPPTMAPEPPTKAAASDITSKAPVMSSPKKDAPKQKRTAIFRDPTVLMHCDPEGEMRPVEVTVFESSEPTATNYALKFEVKHTAGSPVVEGRLDFHSLFEMVTAWSQGEMPREYRLTGGVKGKAIDAAMRKWIVSGTPPERVVLIRWVLWRAVLVLHDADGGAPGTGEVVFVGAEGELAEGSEAHESPADAHGALPGYLPPPSSEYDETPPPSYFSGDPDEASPPPYVDPLSLTTELGPPPPYDDASMTIQLPDMTGEEGFKEWDRDLLVHYQRPDAVRTVDKSAWDHYHWRLTMELKKSHRDLEEMREMRRRQKAVRRAREVELLTKMNVLRHKQKVDTIQRRKTKQMVCDVLDLHEMMETMKMEQKRLSCQIMKDREKITTVKQPYAMRRGKHQPGAHLGDGPIPYPATTRPSDNPESRVAQLYHWDAHGRRHKRDGPPPPGSFYEEAMKVIVKLSSSGFERHLCLHRAFKHFDRDENHKVTLSEFATALQVLKPKPTTEQLVTLFRHFDPNGTGAVNYGEFLTQFFSRRKFLKAMAETEQAADMAFLLDDGKPGRSSSSSGRKTPAAGEAHKVAGVTKGRGAERTVERPGSRSRTGQVLRSKSADHLIVSQVESLQAYMETMNRELEGLIARRRQQQSSRK